MERLELKRKDALNALATLADITKESYSVIVRDATIQRFEYTFEAFWKYIKEYLKEKEGVLANAPKACFREILLSGLVNNDETIQLMEMTDKRNDTSHTYKEAVAQSIYANIDKYVLLMRSVMERTE